MCEPDDGVAATRMTTGAVPGTLVSAERRTSPSLRPRAVPQSESGKNRMLSTARRCRLAEEVRRQRSIDRGWPRMKVIRGKRALVTGAASGIGRATSLALAREGADLYLLDIDEKGLADVATEARSLGVRVRTAACDLVRPSAARSAADELLRAWGGLEILINNAGISYHGNTDTMADEQWDRVLALNLHSPVELTRRL